VTRIARGIPVGSDIEFADEVIMWKAMEGWREMLMPTPAARNGLRGKSCHLLPKS